jgi:hypothetical protein
MAERQLNINIGVKGGAEAQNIFQRMGASIRGLNQSARETSLGGEGSVFRLLAGGGALMGLTLAARGFERMATAGRDAWDQISIGAKTYQRVAREIIEEVPILGNVFMGLLHLQGKKTDSELDAIYQRYTKLKDAVRTSEERTHYARGALGAEGFAAKLAAINTAAGMSYNANKIATDAAYEARRTEANPDLRNQLQKSINALKEEETLIGDTKREALAELNRDIEKDFWKHEQTIIGMQTEEFVQLLRARKTGWKAEKTEIEEQSRAKIRAIIQATQVALRGATDEKMKARIVDQESSKITAEEGIQANKMRILGEKAGVAERSQAQSMLSLLKDEIDEDALLGNRRAARQAKELEVSQKYLAIREQLLAVLRDELSTGEVRRGAIAALGRLDAREARGAGILGFGRPTLGLPDAEQSRFAVGLVARGRESEFDAAKETARNTGDMQKDIATMVEILRNQDPVQLMVR